MRNRFISMLLLLTIALTWIPASVFAANAVSSGTCGNDLTWTLDNAGTLSISGSGKMYNYSQSDLPPWHAQSSAIRTVTINDGVTTVGQLAFDHCGNLTEVTISPSVSTIGDEAFSFCTNLSSITIPAGVTLIANSTFYSCTSLNNVVLPSSLKSIGYQSFYGCSSLKSVSLPSGLTGIAGCAFENCTGLTEILIPSSVTEITGPFSGCISLSSITVEPANGTFSSVDGVLYDKKLTTLICCPCGKKGTCSVPSGVSRIDWRAFSDCSRLTGIEIPASVTSIESQAFLGCSSLTHIEIPSGISSIDWRTFKNCSSLSSISIPSSVTSIWFGAFQNCTGLSDVYFEGTETEWNAVIVDSDNECLTNAALHFSAGTQENEDSQIAPVNEFPEIVETGSLTNFDRKMSYKAGQFSDVPAGKWFSPSVEAAYEYGIMMGNSDGTFGLDAELTVSQTIAIAARLHNIYYGGNGLFDQGKIWYQIYMDYAEKYQIIKSASLYPNPNAPATRAQFAEIVGGAFPEEALPAINRVNAIPDVNRSASYCAAVLRLYNAGILQGNDEYGTFRPDSTIKRTEVAAMTTRLIDPSLRVKFTLQ